MSTTAEKIAVMQAFERGAVIQMLSGAEDAEWVDIPSPKWNWSCNEYRAKPKAREWWINVYPSGLNALHTSRGAAAIAMTGGGLECVHVREVVE